MTKNLLKHAMKFGHNLYPPYSKLLEAKSKTYPNGIMITDEYGSIPLQILLGNTTTRLLSTLNEEQLEDFKDFKVISKYGMDGSSGYQT